MNPSDFDSHAIARFLDLARRGQFRTASVGERIAHKLAKCLDEIGDDMAVLDIEAIQGCFLMMQLAHGPWSDQAGKNLVFAQIHRAAA